MLKIKPSAPSEGLLEYMILFNVMQDDEKWNALLAEVARVAGEGLARLEEKEKLEKDTK